MKISQCFQVSLTTVQEQILKHEIFHIQMRLIMDQGKTSKSNEEFYDSAKEIIQHELFHLKMSEPIQKRNFLNVLPKVLNFIAKN